MPTAALSLYVDCSELLQYLGTLRKVSSRTCTKMGQLQLLTSVGIGLRQLLLTCLTSAGHITLGLVLR